MFNIQSKIWRQSQKCSFSVLLWRNTNLFRTFGKFTLFQQAKKFADGTFTILMYIIPKILITYLNFSIHQINGSSEMLTITKNCTLHFDHFLYHSKYVPILTDLSFLLISSLLLTAKSWGNLGTYFIYLIKMKHWVNHADT